MLLCAIIVFRCPNCKSGKKSSLQIVLDSELSCRLHCMLCAVLFAPNKGRASGSSGTSRTPETCFKYPAEFEEENTLAFDGDVRCKHCIVYVPREMLLPCCHAQFCFKCVNDLRREAIALNRPAKCFISGCYRLVESWSTCFQTLW